MLFFLNNLNNLMKNSAEKELGTSGIQFRNSDCASKSYIKGKIETKVEKNEYQSPIKSNIPDKITQNYNEIDLFGKRLSELDQIQKLQQRIAELVKYQMEVRDSITHEKNEKAKQLFMKTYQRILKNLKQLKKELATKKMKEQETDREKQFQCIFTNNLNNLMKTSAKKELHTSGIYFENDYLKKQCASKSYRYYSLDMHIHIQTASNVERTKAKRKVHQSPFRSKIADKISKKYNEIDLFGKRSSEVESSIYQLKQRIAKLEKDKSNCRDALTLITNEISLNLIRQDYQRTLNNLKQLKKELATKKMKKQEIDHQKEASNK